MFYHLHTAERRTFYAVLVIAVAVFSVELLDFEREVIEAELPYVGRDPEEVTD